MPVLIECPNCKSRYRAGDNLAGRRIKCRHCGATVTVPSGEPSLGESDLSALEAAEEVERNAASQADEKPDSPVPAEPPGGIDPLDVADATQVARGPRARPLFRYPMSDRVDQLLPWLVTGITLVCTVRAVVRSGQGGEDWLGPLRALLAMLFCVGVVYPIGLLGLMKGLRRVHAGLPSGHPLRSYAAFSVPFAMGCVPWLVTGDPVDLVAGGIFGLAIALGLVWLLYRLRADELAEVLPFAGAGVIASLAACVMLMSLANLTTRSIVKGLRVKHPVSSSPFGLHFAWLPAPSAPALAGIGSSLPPDAVPLVTMDQQPGPNSASPPTRPSPPPAPTRLALLKSVSPLVQEVFSPLPEAFDEVIFPAIPSDYAAVLRRSDPEEDRIELWQTTRWERAATVRFKHEPNARDRCILSADGDYLVRIVNWPRLAAQVWSFKQNRVLRNIDWRGHAGTSELLGFAGKGVFLVQWAVSDGPWLIEQWDAASGELRQQQVKHLPEHEGTGGEPAVSPDGRYLAVTARAPVPATAPANPLPPADSPGALFVYDLDSPTPSPQAVIPIAALDPRWPVRPTGIAFSPDSSMIALLFEHNENVLLLCWRVADRAQLAEYVYPASPIPDPAGRAFPGSVLDWVGGGAWCLCGQVLLDAGNSRPIGSFDLLTNDGRNQRLRIVDQRLIGSTCEVVYEASNAQRQLGVIRLSPTALGTTAPATRPARAGN